jgi:hypothetical protein
MNFAALNYWRRLKSAFLPVVLLSAVIGASCPVTAQIAPPRQPLGIYAIADVDGCVSNPNAAINPATGGCISNSIMAILSNPAVSGIAAFVRWSDISLTIPTNSLTGTNEWNVLDDIFGAVAQWNTDNPGNDPALDFRNRQR